MKVPIGQNMIVNRYERTFHREHMVSLESASLFFEVKSQGNDLVTALREVEQVDNPRKLTSWIFSRGLTD